MPALPPALDPLDAAGLRAQPEHSDVELVDLDLCAERLTALSLEAARVKGCRFAGAELRRLHCAQVVFETCDFANTRWFDCDFNEVAFLACRFTGASLTGVELFNVDLKGCDLRDNELADLKGAGCLRGATIDALQLLSLGPALAAHVGLVVEEAGIEEG